MMPYQVGLIHAVLSNDQKLAIYLIENGSDVNHRNITGLTALEVAKAHGHTAMVNFLIKSGATVLAGFLSLGKVDGWRFFVGG
jgi:ankyrin repeat protein